jgi:hypothetical protein
VFLPTIDLILEHASVSSYGSVVKRCRKATLFCFCYPCFLILCCPSVFYRSKTLLLSLLPLQENFTRESVLHSHLLTYTQVADLLLFFLLLFSNQIKKFNFFFVYSVIFTCDQHLVLLMWQIYLCFLLFFLHERRFFSAHFVSLSD